MTVPHVPTVPTSNHQRWNAVKVTVSAGFDRPVPTVPTYFIKRERKGRVHGIGTPQRILWADKFAVGWNGWNRGQKRQICGPSGRSNSGTVAWNGLAKAGTL